MISETIKPKHSKQEHFRQLNKVYSILCQSKKNSLIYSQMRHYAIFFSRNNVIVFSKQKKSISPFLLIDNIIFTNSV